MAGPDFADEELSEERAENSQQCREDYWHGFFHQELSYR